MLDVHPPTEPVHGWRDFFIHLTTITIGLLIALSMEGCVEWQHHRHLVHEAEASLTSEIRANASEVKGALEDVRKEQEVLKKDVAVMNTILANPKKPNREDLTVNFRIRTFNDVGWRTSQSTGAFSYMPYDEAHEYSDIYYHQDEIETAEHQAVRDTVIAVAPILNLKQGDVNPSGEEAVKCKEHFEILQGQLKFIESMIAELDREYKKFLAVHPE